MDNNINNQNNQDNYTELNGRIVKIETEIQEVRSDVNELKGASKELFENINRQELHQSNTNALLSKNITMLNLTLRQNSEVIKNSAEALKTLKEDTEKRFEKLNNKTDSFKEFLIDIGKKILAIALSGGLIFSILEAITKGRLLNLFM